MQQLLPEKYSRLLIAPSFLEVAEVFLGRLLLRLPSKAHGRHWSMSVPMAVTMTMLVAVAVLAIRAVLVLVHY